MQHKIDILENNSGSKQNRGKVLNSFENIDGNCRCVNRNEEAVSVSQSTDALALGLRDQVTRFILGKVSREIGLA